MTVQRAGIGAALTNGSVAVRRTFTARAQEEITQRLREVEAIEALPATRALTAATVQAFWQGDERAQITIRTLGRLLDIPLEEQLRRVASDLALAEKMPLAGWSSRVAPGCFQAINGMVAPPATPRKGFAAAERVHYSWVTRHAVLQQVLTALHAAYPAPRFGSLAEATAWISAYAVLLQSAEEVLSETEALLATESKMLLGALATIRKALEKVESRADQAGIILRRDWHDAVARAEQTVTNVLADASASLNQVTFGEIAERTRAGRDGAWLAKLALVAGRHAPRLGLMLLAVGGAGVAGQMVNGVLQPPTAPAPIRRTVAPSEMAGQRAGEVVLGQPTAPQTESAIAAFFRTLPEARGRQRLEIPTQAALVETLTHLERAGYSRGEVLRLLGLPSVEALSSPLAIDVRQGASGRLALFPNAAPTTQEGLAARLGAIARLFGVAPDGVRTATDEQGETHIEIPAVRWNQTIRNGQPPLIQWGARLDQVAHLFGVAVDRLADLNGIINPAGWLYEGRPLTLPGEALRANIPIPVGQAASAAAGLAGAVVPASTAAREGLMVYRVQPGETLQSLAERYGISVETLQADNPQLGEALASGQTLLVRAAARPEVSLQGTTAAAPTTPSSTMTSADLVARYGQTRWASIEEMPAEVRDFYLGTVQEVAAFFNVRPGDIMGILRAEQNNAGWTLHEPAISSAGAAGVAQVIARTWNGWANPHHASHAQSLADIERYGGLGFDWSARQHWLDWKQGRADRDSLSATRADPQVFENGVAAIARHLANWGLTADKAQADPAAFETRLADAIAVYNSGRPLSVSANYTQSPANAKTVAMYVGDAVATSAAVAAHFLGAPALAATTQLVVGPTLAPVATARVQPLPSDGTVSSAGSLAPSVELTLSADGAQEVVPALEGAAAQMAVTLERAYDNAFGVQLSERQLAEMVAAQTLLVNDISAGKLTAEQAAERLVQEAEARFLAEGQAARSGGRERPWPFVYNAESLQTQRMAVSFMGRMLSRTELDRLLEETNAQPEAIRQRLQSRGDARLFATARHLFTQMLERESRAIPVTNAEVAQLIAPFLAGLDPYAMTAQQVGALADKVQAAIREGAEFRALNGEIRFAAPPLSPMPSVFKGFGVSVSYQAGGRHTGIDVANPPEADGRQPQIFAVADGTVAHVGPLYCEQANACRGGKSIILDLGNQTYAIYSHNSEAAVKVGDKVKAGQPIGRQGDEGYSFGSHLHFEVHTGAPFSGNWERPFDGGQFVDPMSFMGQ